MAFIVGAGLSLCGVLMQALTKNILADPYVLGISSGASAVECYAILMGSASWADIRYLWCHLRVPLSPSVCLSELHRSMGRITSTQLVLAGIATSAFSRRYQPDDLRIQSGSDKTKMALYWMVGSLSGATWGKRKICGGWRCGKQLVIFLFAKELDVLLLGDDVAEHWAWIPVK